MPVPAVYLFECVEQPGHTGVRSDCLLRFPSGRLRTRRSDTRSQPRATVASSRLAMSRSITERCRVDCMAGQENSSDIARRDFVVQAAAAFGAVGLAAACWPFVAQMNPNSATPPPEVRDVDLTEIPPAATKLVRWRGAPVFVRHRTREEVQEARSTPLSNLPDPLARNAVLPEKAPALDSNRTKVGHEEWLVVIGLCTHLGCMLTQNPMRDLAETWFCRCHAARFDVSGRVRAGPARTNLPVPPYDFITASKIRIG